MDKRVRRKGEEIEPEKETQTETKHFDVTITKISASALSKEAAPAATSTVL